MAENPARTGVLWTRPWELLGSQGLLLDLRESVHGILDSDQGGNVLLRSLRVQRSLTGASVEILQLRPQISLRTILEVNPLAALVLRVDIRVALAHDVSLAVLADLARPSDSVESLPFSPPKVGHELSLRHPLGAS